MKTVMVWRVMTVLILEERLQNYMCICLTRSYLLQAFLKIGNLSPKCETTKEKEEEKFDLKCFQ